MSLETELEDLKLCRAYLKSQLEDQPHSPTAARWTTSGPAITISYQTGSGAHEIARTLANLLQKNEAEASTAWTVFDRQLVEKVLEEHHLPKTLAKFMPEDRRSFIRDVMEELVGLHPPSWVMVPQVAETVLHLAEAGHVILVGRGASFITARMPNVFHVRLIASLPRRIERVRKLENLSAQAAAKFIAQRDRRSGRYLKTYFHARADDDLLYHLVINTDLLPDPTAAQLIADAARRCFQGFQAS